MDSDDYILIRLEEDLTLVGAKKRMDESNISLDKFYEMNQEDEEPIFEIN